METTTSFEEGQTVRNLVGGQVGTVEAIYDYGEGDIVLEVRFATFNGGSTLVACKPSDVRAVR